MPNHPAYLRVRKILSIPYRVYFTTLGELNSLLNVRNFEEVSEGAWDNLEFREWYNKRDRKHWDLFKVATKLFDAEGGFIPNAVSWNEKLIVRQLRLREDIDDVDDIPF